VITPRSLGGVTIGMTLAQATAAAGVQIVEVGDGYGYPSGNSGMGIGIVGPPNDPAACVFAARTTSGPAVVTAQGFLLGGTVQALQALYGSRLRYVPKPTTGYMRQAGYVVSFPDGNLAFATSQGIVTAISGGPGVTPSSC
jgi:hypothetical protein